MLKYEIIHTNIFRYETNVEQSLNTIRLKPIDDTCQRLLSYQNIIKPASMTKEHVDLWGNHVESFFIPEKHNILEVQSQSIVSIHKTPFVHQIEYTPEMKMMFESELFKEHYLPFLTTTEYTYIHEEQVREVIHEIGPCVNPIQFSLDVNAYLHHVFTYDTEATTVDTKARDSFKLKRGVCQDYTHIMLGILRANGVPARYVSGYLYVGNHDGWIGDVASHAWIEAMIPGVGWVGLDPTNNVEAADTHPILSVGRDYTDVSPLQGVYHGGPHTLEVQVSVNKLD